MTEARSPEESSARDHFIEAVLAVVPAEQREGPRGVDLRARIAALADAVVEAQRDRRETQEYRDEDMRRINEAAARVRELDSAFDLSQVDQNLGDRLATGFVDAANMLADTVGLHEHEGEWNGERWTTWNFDFECVPTRWAAPEPLPGADAYAPVQELVRAATHLRVVGAGHSFNESTCTGGRKGAPSGTLLSLDRYDRWERLPAEEAAQRFGLSGDEAGRVVRVQAGKRLRDYSSAIWGAGLAMPLAGSTDAQSLGGLLATDLHGTGRDHGFLSEQVLQVRLVTATGDLVTISRTADGWVTDERPARAFRWLPVAGALGMLGVVVELTLKADRAYYLRKGVRYIPRADAENDLEALLGQHDHMSFYYLGGPREVITVRHNTWDLSPSPPGFGASFSRLVHELSDHTIAAFVPGVLTSISHRDARTDPLLALLNQDPPVVLRAPDAFARRLFYQHDEIEYGLPRADWRTAVAVVMDLCAREQLDTIIEMRFAPDRSQALLGPGTAGRGKGGTAFIELATAFGQHSHLRVAEVFEKLHEVLVPLGGRPHLGKKTAIDGAGMKAIYGADWEAFQALRRAWDPEGKLLPPDNVFLNKVFAA
jgi:FAD/FMN-containing dehydrogenase